MIAKSLSHYEIVAKIGAGGMGEVYRAHDPRLGRDVALKVLPEAVSAHSDRLARFEREAKTLAALNHPHIVTIYSIEESEGIRFLTMELIEGDGLGNLVPAGGMPLKRALDLAIALADALAAAHDKGIVHRDLKPSNVMVTKDRRLKVLDFGLAKPAGADGPNPDFSLAGTQAMSIETPVSAEGVVVGTVPYMAPEQVRGEPVDARADLFSFGILLYEMLTGNRPFAGKTQADVSSSILRDTPVPVQSLRADVPRDLERIVGRCLEKDCERRFQTAKDVRNELEIVRREVTAGTAPVASSVSSTTATVPPVDPTSTIPSTSTTVTAAPESEKPSIAVLPFVNRSRDEEDEYFSDGLADELLSVLAKIRGLRVAARTSSSSFKGKDATIAEIGESLRVATVLEGSVRRVGNRVRIAVQLVKVEDGYPLWSETFDRTLDDIFAVQDDIAQSVVKELRTTLLGEEADSKASGEAKAEVAAAARGRGHDAEAHRLYLQGKYFIDRLSEEDTARGVECLQQAIEIDPDHALARVQLAQALSNQAGWGWAPVFEGNREARQVAEKAVQLAPDLAEAYVTLAHILLAHYWDWDAAKAAVDRARELAPDSPDVLREAGRLASTFGRMEEARQCLERAAERDPLSSTIYGQLGHVYRRLDRPADAIEAFRKSLDLSPRRIIAHMMIGLVLAEEGKFEEALPWIEKEPAEWSRLCGMTLASGLAGRQAEADEALRKLKEEYALECAVQIGFVHAWRGDIDEAFEWLERAYAQRDGGLIDIVAEPTVRPLHGDPRWHRLLEKMGLPH